MFSKPPSDPREQPVLPTYDPPTDEQWEILAVQEGLYNAIQKYGVARVMTWFRSMATIAGQEIN